MTREPAKWLLLAFKLIVTFGALGWLASKLDLAAVWQALAQLGLAPVAIAVVLMVAHIVVLAWRWVRVVDHLRTSLPFAQALRWTFVGVFFNQALPSSVGGDAVRVWALHRRGMGIATAFGSVAIERSTGLVVVGILVSISAAIAVPRRGHEAAWLPLVLVGPVAAIGLAAVAWLGAAIARWLPRPVAEAVRGLHAGLGALLRNPSRMIELFLWAALATTLNLGAAFAIGHALHIGVGPVAFTALAGGAALLAVLPVSLGGWGVREASMLFLFAPSGGPAEAVIACSVLWGLLPAVVSAPALLLGRPGRLDTEADALSRATR